MNAPCIVIVNYGLGNLFSVQRALERVGARVVISDEPRVIERASHLILPGVGAFSDGMRNLRERGMDAALVRYAHSGRPLLGVCLGMQLLMTTSEEFGLHEGLNFIEGRVTRFRRPEEGNGFKIPHIGWNAIHAPTEGSSKGDLWKETLLEDVGEGAFMYFLHSYRVVPDDSNICLALTHYGRDTYCSVFRKGNIMGVQFHPERSSEAGLEIYRNFVFNSN